MKTNPKRNLGELGEIELKRWCAQVGLTANKVENDSKGWDFFVEFPLISHTKQTLPLDLTISPLKCLIQVKATDKIQQNIKIKLSNWIHLIKNPLPSFFMIFEFDGKNDCQRAFLVHVWRFHIEKTLKKLRKLTSHDGLSIHKKTLQLKYTLDEILSPMDGNGLTSALKKNIGDSIEKYAEKKIELLKKIGYNEKNTLFDFQIDLPEHKEDIKGYLIDFLIGIEPDLKIKKIGIRDIRFGMPSSLPMETFGKGRLEIIHQPQKCSFTFSAGKEKATILLDAFFPAGVCIEDKSWKARFSSPVFEFILSYSENSEFEIDLGTKDSFERMNIPLINLLDFSKLIEFFHRSKGHKKKLRIKIDEIIVTGEITQKEEGFIGNNERQKLSDSIKSAWKICKHLNIEEKINPVALELLHQHTQLQLMEGIFLRHRKCIQASIFIDEIQNDTIETKQKICIPYLSHCVIGSKQIAVSAAIIEEALFLESENPLEYRLESTDIRPCRHFIWERGTSPPHSSKEAIEMVINDYKELTKIVLLKGVHDNVAP